jgi:hypothetical protein
MKPVQGSERPILWQGRKIFRFFAVTRVFDGFAFCGQIRINAQTLIFAIVSPLSYHFLLISLLI